jgi:hypothetical protein
MAIKLFDIQNSKITPTEHCYAISSLKRIMKEYPKDYLSIYAYLFYKTCLIEEENPFANVPEVDKDDIILKEVGGDFLSDDPLIEEALETCYKLYETPTYNLYLAAKVGIEKVSKYIRNVPITDGRDGNNISYLRYIEKYAEVCRTFEDRYKAFKEEQSTIARGGHKIAYDQ